MTRRGQGLGARSASYRGRGMPRESQSACFPSRAYFPTSRTSHPKTSATPQIMQVQEGTSQTIEGADTQDKRRITLTMEGRPVQWKDALRESDTSRQDRTHRLSWGVSRSRPQTRNPARGRVVWRRRGRQWKGAPRGCDAAALGCCEEGETGTAEERGCDIGRGRRLPRFR